MTKESFFVIPTIHMVKRLMKNSAAAWKRMQPSATVVMAKL